MFYIVTTSASKIISEFEFRISVKFSRDKPCITPQFSFTSMHLRHHDISTDSQALSHLNMRIQIIWQCENFDDANQALSEGKMLLELDHTNVIQYYDFFLHQEKAVAGVCMCVCASLRALSIIFFGSDIAHVLSNHMQ
jgi:hypothetical protein